ncbi:RGCVC family protein [Nocardia sp. NPDC051570]|uniref:RGCVC family protein n=1 Tax=Nocardia sp. NPDC051570 TaxID=3364324 RepID=UPI003788277C
MRYPAMPESSCAACPHAWEVHDPIGIRFCFATTARGLDRECVCARSVDREKLYYR